MIIINEKLLSKEILEEIGKAHGIFMSWGEDEEDYYDRLIEQFYFEPNGYLEGLMEAIKEYNEKEWNIKGDLE